MSDVIAGLGGRADYVAVVPHVDTAKLQLSPDESSLFSMVGRAAQIQEVIKKSGLSEARAIAVLLQLRAKGAIVPARVSKSVAQPVADAAGQEQVELSEERKAEILAMELGLESKNYFELLGVSAASSASDARVAFYELSRRFHPDRFFGKNLGSFRGRVEKIFLKLSHAHEVLTDDAKKDKYLKANPGLLVSHQGAAPVRARSAAPAPEAPRPRTAEDDARDAERRARLAKHPYLAKKARVNELVARARSQLSKGNPGHAFTDLNMASQMDPDNDEVKTLLVEVRARNDADRSDSEFKRGQGLLEQENPKGALAAWRSAVNINPANGQAAFEAAKLMWYNDGNAKEACGFAQKAVDAQPKNAAFHVLLGQLMEEVGHKAMAKKHFEEALRLDPSNAAAKKQVKGRWPF